MIRLLLAASLFTTLGCATFATTRMTPVVSLAEVERPASAKERYGDQVLGRATNDSGLTRFTFEDQMVKAFFLVLSSEIHFELTNKTPYSIRLLWNEVTFVSPDGEPSPVMHVGTKYTECRNEKPAAVIPKGVTVTDQAVPCSRVRMGMSTWVQDPLIAGFVASTHPTNDTLVVRQEKEMRGKRMSLLLPLQIEGVTNEYTFTFSVDSLIVRRPAAKPKG